mmetsp:Transcript_123442/g.356913  ORF Transcript_123442/g.356913 Transcript_123442/m.356913 type:complete len:223 (+) Transcript_123442:138-806(+)
MKQRPRIEDRQQPSDGRPRPPQTSLHLDAPEPYAEHAPQLQGAGVGVHLRDCRGNPSAIGRREEFHLVALPPSPRPTPVEPGADRALQTGAGEAVPVRRALEVEEGHVALPLRVHLLQQLLRRHIPQDLGDHRSPKQRPHIAQDEVALGVAVRLAEGLGEERALGGLGDGDELGHELLVGDPPIIAHEGGDEPIDVLRRPQVAESLSQFLGGDHAVAIDVKL